jgi:hypothetical protein
MSTDRKPWEGSSAGGSSLRSNITDTIPSGYTAGLSSPFARAFRDAANEHWGISDWELEGLFEKCDNCGRWFSSLALRAHIPTHE